MKKRFVWVIAAFFTLSCAFSQTDVSFLLGNNFTFAPASSQSSEEDGSITTGANFALTTYTFVKNKRIGFFFPLEENIYFFGSTKESVFSTALGAGLAFKIPINEESALRFALGSNFSFTSAHAASLSVNTLGIALFSNIEYLYEAFPGEYFSPNLVLGTRISVQAVNLNLSSFTKSTFGFLGLGVTPYAGISLRLKTGQKKNYVVKGPSL